MLSRISARSRLSKKARVEFLYTIVMQRTPHRRIIKKLSKKRVEREENEREK